MRMKRTGCPPGRRALSVLLSLVLCLSLLPATAAAVGSVQVGDFTLTSAAALTAGNAVGENDYYFEAAEENGGGTLYLHTNTPVTVSNTASTATSSQHITVQAPSTGTEGYEPKITLSGVHTSGDLTTGTDHTKVYPLALTVTGENDLGQVLLWDNSSAGSNRATVTMDGDGTLKTDYLRPGLPVESTTLSGITLHVGNLYADGALEINGGTVEAQSIFGRSVTISGGSVTSTGTGGYGIYGAHGVTISGDAVVHATGGTLSGESQAGIGVGSGHTITIGDRAQVTATGGPPPSGSFAAGAPGIGMISQQQPSTPISSATIIIKGSATVTATGTKKSAGIGAGRWTAADVTISGSPTITAQGGESGAGIGLGMNNSSSAAATIQISGTPKISAQAGPDGFSGIGLGDGMATIDATITGGSFAQGDISTQTVGGQKVATGCYVDRGAESDYPYVVKTTEGGQAVLVPTAVELQMGRTQQFTLVGAASTVAWSVEGANDNTTTITEGGLLTLGMNETADNILTVTATVDGGSSYAATVTVREPVYTVTLAPGEGTGTEQTVPVTRNDGAFTYVLPAVGTEVGAINFTAPADKHFAGWQVSGSATAEGDSADGQVLAAGTVITLTGDVTLTANWAVTPVVTLYGVELTDGETGTGYSYAYDQTTGVSTLTLNGYQGSGTATGEEDNSDGYYSALDCNHDLVLVLNGTSSLGFTGTGTKDSDVIGINVNGDLTIQDGSSEGTGFLSVDVTGKFGNAIYCEGGLAVKGGDVTARLSALAEDSSNSVLYNESTLQVTGGSLTLIDASLEDCRISITSLSDDFQGKIMVAHQADGNGAYETDYDTAWDSDMPTFPYVRVEAEAGYTQPTVYPVWVEGKQVTEENKSDVLGDGTVAYTPGTDNSSGTLTLNNSQITAPGGEGNRVGIDGAALYAARALTLSVTGDNTLSGTAVQVQGGTESYGIYLYNSDLMVTGTGALTATGTAAEDSYGIFADMNNNLTVNGGVVVTGIAGQRPEGAENAIARGIFASSAGESSVLVSSNRSGADLLPLADGEHLEDFPYCVVYNPAATEVVICRNDAVVTADSLQVPAEDSLTVTYTATILDQVGLEMKDQSVIWSMEGDLPQGVSVENNRVTVDADAADGSFTLTAAGGGMTASVVITVSNKADAGVTISGAPTTTITYGDRGFTLSANAAQTGNNGSWTWTSSDENVLQVTQSTDGSATVAVTGAGAATITANYSSDTTVGSATVELTVAPKAVTITGLTAADKEYNGDTVATASGTPALNGVAGDDKVTISNGSASFADKHVGTGKTVTFTGYSLTGADAGNYTLSAQPASVTADITPKTIGVTGLAATNRAYNGTTRVDLTDGTLDGVIQGDTVELDLANAYGDITDANVGNGKVVAVSGLALSGADARNYTLGPVTGVTVNITKANAPSLNDVTVQQRYSETIGQASVASVGMPTGAGTLTYAKGKESTTGNVTVTDWSVDASGNVTYTLSGGAARDTVTLPVVISSVNYQDATVSVAITLTEKNNQAPLTLSNAEMTCGGTLTLSAAGGSGTGEVTYAILSGENLATLNGSVLTATGVGTVTVRATKAGDSDYNVIGKEVQWHEPKTGDSSSLVSPITRSAAGGWALTFGFPKRI